MMRLFIALPLGEQAEEYLGRIISSLNEKGGNVRWVKPKNIHLTLRFLGDTDEKLVPDLGRRLNIVAAEFPAVESEIGRLGAFPNLNRPRVIWAGLQEGIDTLEKLARRVERTVRELGFERDKKPFRPHLTLGRIRNNRGLESLTAHIRSAELEKLRIRLNRIVLLKSTLTPQGPIYDSLHEARLGEQRFTD